MEKIDTKWNTNEAVELEAKIGNVLQIKLLNPGKQTDTRDLAQAAVQARTEYPGTEVQFLLDGKGKHQHVFTVGAQDTAQQIESGLDAWVAARREENSWRGKVQMLESMPGMLPMGL